MSDDHNIRKQPENTTFGKGPPPTTGLLENPTTGEDSSTVQPSNCGERTGNGMTLVVKRSRLSTCALERPTVIFVRLQVTLNLISTH